MSARDIRPDRGRLGNVGRPGADAIVRYCRRHERSCRVLLRRGSRHDVRPDEYLFSIASRVANSGRLSDFLRNDDRHRRALFPIGILGSATNMGTLVAFAMVSIAVPVLRRRHPGTKRKPFWQAVSSIT